MTIAWHIAALQRQKTLPKLKTYLGKLSPDQGPQTVSQQRSILHMLSDTYGGQLRPSKGSK